MKNGHAETLYYVECFSAGFGYEPTWQRMLATKDHDEALAYYYEVIQADLQRQYRLTEQIVCITILDETNERKTINDDDFTID